MNRMRIWARLSPPSSTSWLRLCSDHIITAWASASHRPPKIMKARATTITAWKTTSNQSVEWLHRKSEKPQRGSAPFAVEREL
ncbi:hypothetical protein ACFTY8_29670 [Streptomyces mirabilis]|uniref:hypothetical protein n=1 Tax=Streptomyces mirabilis TaxID=68239 RepID=UPI00363BECFD